MSLSKRDTTIVAQITEAIHYLSNEYKPVYFGQLNEYIYYLGDETPDFIEIANQVVNDLLGSILKIGNDDKKFIIEFNKCSIKCFLYNFDYGIRIMKYIEIKIQMN
jgi:hypothetical protein